MSRPGPQDQPGPPGQHGSGRHGGPPLPQFLQDVSEEARQAFFVIFNNWNLTMIEMKNQTDAWASTFGITDLYEAFEKNLTATDAILNTNITSIIANLSSVRTSWDAIFDNKNLTRYQIHEAINALEEKSPQEVDIIMHLRHSEEPPPHGGPGPHGGPPPNGGPPHHDGHQPPPPPPPSEQGIIGGIGGPRFTDDFSFLL